MSYSPEVSLAAFARVLDDFRLRRELRTKRCRDCGECCNQPIPVLGCDIEELSSAAGINVGGLAAELLETPGIPSIDARRKAVGDLMRQNDLPELEATLLYEYNHADPVILKRRSDGTCIFLRGTLCSIYPSRPFMCRLYLCNMGERLSVLYEKIIGQGIWHLYSRLGWIEESELGHNPFVRRRSVDGVRLGDFDVDLEAARDRLFFFF